MTTEKELLKGLTLERLEIELLAREAQIPEAVRFDFEDKECPPIIRDIIAQVKSVYDAAPNPDADLKNISTRKLFQERNERRHWKEGRLDILELPHLRIHGGDGRMEGFEFDNFLKNFNPDKMPRSSRTYIEKVRENSKCTAVVLREQDMEQKGEYFKLETDIFKDFLTLHEEEPFRDQTVLTGDAFTGFLVEENVIATVAHKVNENNVEGLRFVFGYEMNDSGTSNIYIPKKDVYKGKRLIDRAPDDGDSDWALVEIDPPASGRKIAELSQQKIPDEQGVYVWGFPIGLPLKFAGGAYVCDNSYNAYFLANTDTFSGNSGSPVFRSDTHEVVGIHGALVGGGEKRKDLEWCETGRKSIRLPMDCSLGGAQCTRVSEFIDVLKN